MLKFFVFVLSVFPIQYGAASLMPDSSNADHTTMSMHKISKNRQQRLKALNKQRDQLKRHKIQRLMNRLLNYDLVANQNLKILSKDLNKSLSQKNPFLNSVYEAIHHKKSKLTVAQQNEVQLILAVKLSLPALQKKFKRVERALNQMQNLGITEENLVRLIFYEFVRSIPQPILKASLTDEKLSAFVDEQFKLFVSECNQRFAKYNIQIQDEGGFKAFVEKWHLILVQECQALNIALDNNVLPLKMAPEMRTRSLCALSRPSVFNRIEPLEKLTYDYRTLHLGEIDSICTNALKTQQDNIVQFKVPDQTSDLTLKFYTAEIPTESIENLKVSSQILVQPSLSYEFDKHEDKETSSIKRIFNPYVYRMFRLLERNLEALNRVKTFTQVSLNKKNIQKNIKKHRLLKSPFESLAACVKYEAHISHETYVPCNFQHTAQKFCELFPCEILPSYLLKTFENFQKMPLSKKSNQIADFQTIKNIQGNIPENMKLIFASFKPNPESFFLQLSKFAIGTITKSQPLTEFLNTEPCAAFSFFRPEGLSAVLETQEAHFENTQTNLTKIKKNLNLDNKDVENSPCLAIQDQSRPFKISLFQNIEQKKSRTVPTLIATNEVHLSISDAIHHNFTIQGNRNVKQEPSYAIKTRVKFDQDSPIHHVRKFVSEIFLNHYKINGYPKAVFVAGNVVPCSQAKCPSEGLNQTQILHTETILPVKNLSFCPDFAQFDCVSRCKVVKASQQVECARNVPHYSEIINRADFYDCAPELNWFLPKTRSICFVNTTKPLSSLQCCNFRKKNQKSICQTHCQIKTCQNEMPPMKVYQTEIQKIQDLSFAQNASQILLIKGNIKTKLPKEDIKTKLFSDFNKLVKINYESVFNKDKNVLNKEHIHDSFVRPCLSANETKTNSILRVAVHICSEKELEESDAISCF